jgi:hypothetical protein
MGRPAGALLALLLLAACAPVPATPPATASGSATVVGELPGAGAWRTQAVSLQGVVLVQAEIGGPGMTAPLAAQAALDPDNHFAVPFAAVPFGENRPVTVTGYGIDGRPVPGVVLQGWLTVNADGFRGQASAAATPIGAALRSLWSRSGTDPLAALIARQVSPDDLQAFLIKLNADSAQDFSLMDGERIATALLQENRSRTAFDIASNGVRMPTSGQSLIRHPARVRGTLYGLQGDDLLRSLTIDDPLSPGIAPLPTVNGTAFLFYPVAPGARQLTAIYGPAAASAAVTPLVTYRKGFMATDETDATLDLHLPVARPRQLPPGGTLTLTGAGFGTEAGTATLGLGTTGSQLAISRWTASEVAVTLPNPLPSGPQPLQIIGGDWQWETKPLPVLAGAPHIDQATVTASGAVRELHLTGTNFSSFAADHVVTLTGSDSVAVPVTMTRNGSTLDGVIPSRVTGTAVVRLSIGGVTSATTPAVTVAP